MVALDDADGSESSPVRASPSPPTDRVVGVLELLASRPAQAFSLSDIARALGMNKATCHAVTTSLAGADYLIRNPADKTFTLGPALVAAGRAAEQAYPAVHLAHAEVVALAEELGVQATAAIRSEGHLVIVAQAGVGAEAAAVRTGRRIPLAPPFGGVFVAWADRAVVDDWAMRTERPVPREALLESLASKGHPRAHRSTCPPARHRCPAAPLTTTRKARHHPVSPPPTTTSSTTPTPLSGLWTCLGSAVSSNRGTSLCSDVPWPAPDCRRSGPRPWTAPRTSSGACKKWVYR
jgi:hypothetical protein